MAAELDRREDGTASIVLVKQSAWHREGTVLPESPSFDEALRLGGLDYTVEKVPTFIRRGMGPNTFFLQSESAFVTMRTDREQELGAVGRAYEPLQNQDAFGIVEELLDGGLIKLETAGALRGGADAWMLGRFNVEEFGPAVREVFTDEVVPYALFTNNHSGRRNATVAETPIRVVCANTLAMAERAVDSRSSRSVAVRHTRNAARRMGAGAEQLWGAIIERYETMAQQFGLLKKVELSRSQFEALVLNSVAPLPDAASGDRRRRTLAEAAIVRAERRRREITRLWTDGDGHKGDYSAWEAYNAVVQAVDHDTDVFPTRAGASRLQSLVGGRLRAAKSTALQGLLEHCEVAAGRGKAGAVPRWIWRSRN